MGKLTKAQQIVWDVVSERIEQYPQDGIAACGDRSERVASGQRKFVDGMRAARLAAINALGRAALEHGNNPP